MDTNHGSADLNSTVDLTGDSSSSSDEDDDVVITGVTRAPSIVQIKGASASADNANTAGRSVLIAEEVGASKHVDHNLKTYNSMRAGDLVEFHRGLYTHWGVAIGDGKIIHLSGDEDDGLSAGVNGHFGSISGSVFTISGVDFEKAKVKCDDFWDVARQSKADVNNSKDQYIRADPQHVIVRRALSRLGKIGYNMLWSNCEHFASWCRYGMGWSEQVDKFMRIIDRGKSMVTSALMLIGFTPASMRPYISTNASGEEETKDAMLYPQIEHFK